MGPAGAIDERLLEGNRVWRVQTSDGPVLQKFYNERRRMGTKGLLRTATRRLLTSWGGRKTSPSAAGRCATERRLLGLWREAGFDVPRDLTEQHSEMAGPRVAVFEFVEGTTMLDLLRRRRKLERPRRDELLLRFGRQWCRRHDAALHRDEPALIQEHGTFDHVLVSGERLVTIDHEQAFLRGVAVEPLVAKEIGGYLRSLAAYTEPDVFRADLRSLVRGYGRADRLSGVVEKYLSRDRLGGRLAGHIDRLFHRGSGRIERKYAVFVELGKVLDEQAMVGVG